MATEIKSARDALEKIEKLAHCDLCNVYPKYRAKFDAKIGGIEWIAKAALALPRRNCEVGTPEEQDKRFDAFCKSYKEHHGNCFGCAALRTSGDCKVSWMRMPCEADAQWGEDANMAAVDAVDAEIDAAIEAIENDGKDQGGEVRNAVEA